MNISQMIEQFIKDGGPAQVTTRQGQAGVLFTDENEFIPWGDLGYNQEYGFYRISHLPGLHDEVGVNFSTARFLSHDGEEEYPQWAILTDDHTDGFVIGEWGSVAKLYQTLKELVENGKAEEVNELDERLGHPWMAAQEAAKFADERMGISITARAIRYACDRGEIRHATKDAQWRMPQQSFVSWLRNRPKPGPKPR